MVLEPQDVKETLPRTLGKEIPGLVAPAARVLEPQGWNGTFPRSHMMNTGNAGVSGTGNHEL